MEPSKDHETVYMSIYIFILINAIWPRVLSYFTTPKISRELEGRVNNGGIAMETITPKRLGSL